MRLLRLIRSAMAYREAVLIAGAGFVECPRCRYVAWSPGACPRCRYGGVA